MKKVASDLEIVLIFVGFLASMFHWGLCAAFFAALLFLTRQGTIGCVKGLLIVTTRGILSTAVSAGLNSTVQLEKWAVIFLFSLFILLSLGRYPERPCVPKLRSYVFAFSLYAIVSSYLTSSYPVVSVFKVIAYAVPFCAVTSGVSATNDRVDWMQYLFWVLTPIILLCAVTIPFEQYKLVNDSFQGAINHPNLMGIFGAIYVGVALYELPNLRGVWKVMGCVLLAVTFYMIYLTDSRTGMFSALFTLVIRIASMRGASKTRTILVLIAVSLFAVYYFTEHPEAYTETVEEINHFIYKRDTDDILDSRHEQVDASQEKYHAHPVFGSGFAVPYEEGVVDRKFSMDVTYEAGNIAISVLGDCGILGSVLFWWYILHMFLHTQRNKWVLFFLPIVVSFGEMAFFATNNVAIYYYFLYGICLGKEEGAKYYAA